MVREPVYSALYARSAEVIGLNLVRRRLRHWSDMSPGEYPALFQGQGNEVNVKQRGLPNRWTLSPLQYLYAYAGEDLSVDPSTLINPMLDRIEAAYPDEGSPNVQTLGGLVSHAWITKIETMEGVLGAIEVAIIYFDILVV